MIKKILVIVLLFGTFSGSYAQMTPDQVSLVEEVLKLSEIKKQIEHIPDLCSEQLSQLKPNVNSEGFAEINKIVLQAYQPDLLYKIVTEEVKSNYDKDNLTAMLKWFRSPLAKKISQLDSQAYTPEGVRMMRDYVVKLQLDPPPEERLALFRRFDKATGATELAVNIRVSGLRGMYKAVNPIVPHKMRLKQEQIEKLVNDMKARLQEPSERNSKIVFLSLYQTLSVEELTQYTEFMESDAGRWFNRVMNQAILKAMSSADEKATGQIAKILLRPSQKK